ncbi:hypothetical protein [Oscillatoria salina]|uniref:hypothetical protein n=1 Tax=Oscillatoria salina TaxID=331517 RepID=UPI001CCC579A|nr:hypothetical protein [Oscillatoria salina]MBZ8180408.1 hypothetical protein [Oscillatoria salina IIICB1]
MKRQKLTRYTIVAVALAVTVGFGLSLLSDVSTGVAIAIILLSSFFSYQYPRTGLWIFLIYLPISGSITYSIGAGNPLYHLIKDAFYIPPLFALIDSAAQIPQPHPKIKPLIPALFLLVAVCLITLLFVNVPQQIEAGANDNSVLVGILGLKVLLGYIPLIFCAYYLIRSKSDLFFLMRLHVILIIICCSLGLLQYILLVTGVCPGSTNLSGEAIHKATLEARCLVGGSLLYYPEWKLIRLPGTFVAPWQWGWFLISSSFFSYATSISDRQIHWRILSWIALAAIVVMAVISGQRIALALVPATLIILTLLTDKHKHWLPVKLGGVLLIATLIASNSEKVQQRLRSFIFRWNASPPHYFIVDQFDWVIAEQSGWLGNGLGKATNSARILANTKLIETYYAGLLYEIGPVGVLAFLSVISVLILLTYNAYRSLKEPSLRDLAICLWVFVFLVGYNTYYYPLAVDPVAVYYWFFVGVMLKLPEIDTALK